MFLNKEHFYLRTPVSSLFIGVSSLALYQLHSSRGIDGHENKF
jgi:hypothetical protein